MNTLFDNFRDPAWWATVVVFGLLVNLLSAYLKPLLDRVPGSLAASIRGSVDSYFSEIDALRASPNRQLFTQLLKIEYLIKIFAALVVAFLLFFGSSRAASLGQPRLSIALTILGIFAGLYSSGCVGRYRRFSDTLRAAWAQSAKLPDA